MQEVKQWDFDKWTVNNLYNICINGWPDALFNGFVVDNVRAGSGRTGTIWYIYSIFNILHNLKHQMVYV